jgi:uncharacterized DUF497 family protein
MKFHDFDWDDGNWPKCGEHGVDKREIEEILQSDPLVLPDIEHSSEEPRRWAVGHSRTSERMVFIVFTLRDGPGGILLRPISARYMHEKEVRKYERTKEK